MTKQNMIKNATPRWAGPAILLLAAAALLPGCAEQDNSTNVAPRADQKSLGYAADHIVVKFASGLSVESRAALARAAGAVGVEQPMSADFYYLKLDEGEDPAAVAGRLAGRPGVVYAEPDPPLHLLFTPNDEYYRLQWHFQKIGMERAWDINPGGGSDVIVAVADSGVAFTDSVLSYPAGLLSVAAAPDLKGVNFVSPYNFVWNNQFPVDFHGHGTHVTGTIAQRTNNGIGVAGMAYNVSIMPLKVAPSPLDYYLGLPLPPASYSANIAGFASRLAQATRYAADNGAHVINMSIGFYIPAQSVEDALKYAVGKGVFIAIAAGNEAEQAEDNPFGIINPVEYPAKYAEAIDGVVAVAALDYNLKRTRYSNYQSYVEIAAPGGDTSVDLNGDRYSDGVLQQTLACSTAVISGNSIIPQLGCLKQFDYKFMQGTSMATPHVAGFAALLVSQGIRSPGAVEAAMKRFATDIPPEGRDVYTGYGVINPRDTLMGLGIAR